MLVMSQRVMANARGCVDHLIPQIPTPIEEETSRSLKKAETPLTGSADRDPNCARAALRADFGMPDRYLPNCYLPNLLAL
jgi:hypothetical protein